MASARARRPHSHLQRHYVQESWRLEPVHTVAAHRQVVLEQVVEVADHDARDGWLERAANQGLERGHDVRQVPRLPHVDVGVSSVKKRLVPGPGWGWGASSSLPDTYLEACAKVKGHDAVLVELRPQVDDDHRQLEAQQLSASEQSDRLPKGGRRWGRTH